MSDLGFKAQIDRNQKFKDKIQDDQLNDGDHLNEYKSRPSEDHWEENF